MTSMLTLTLFASGAFAAADLDTTLALPGGADVYDTQVVEVTVANVGNRNANNTLLTIELPETNTSPTVHVMGIVGAIDSRCDQSGTLITCNLGKIRKNRSKTVDFEIVLPWSAGSLDFSTTASTSSSESNLSNNTDSGAGQVAYIDTPIAGPAVAVNRHCTGQGLEAFYECSLYPSSISSHSIVLEGDGSISFLPAQPGYTGSWAQNYDDSLWFEYSFNGSAVLDFVGNGVGGNCFEGLTIFAGSAWVAPYEVCL